MTEITLHKVTPENWSHTHYQLEELRAIISFGANWNESDSDMDEFEMIYFVTVLDKDDQEVFQEQFQTLTDACNYINKRYQNEWPIVDLTKPKNSKEGGCATCVAH